MPVADPLFLGLDLSTQQLKAVIIAQDASIVHESSVHFDKDLPHFVTTNGVLRGPSEGEVTSPVAMWLEAIDLLFERMKGFGVAFDRISAVSGAGQQHGSVYWSEEAQNILNSMNPTLSLAEQLSPKAFSLPRAPIWQDSSTTAECRQIEEAIGGDETLTQLTGSRAYERFTGSQIAKIRRNHAMAYKSTARISLVSSFIASVFLGQFAPIEISDASGMNLMDVITCKWNTELLEICGGPELRSKLGPEPVRGGMCLGRIAAWWSQRWGMNEDCIVAPFTGDNPASVVSVSAPGDAILSLGTSTTFLLSVPPSSNPPKRFTTSHLLAHPTTVDGYIAMLCYKNGALAREQIRDRFASHDWTKFSQMVEATPPGCNGHLGLYFPLPEIIPPGVTGEFYFVTDKQPVVQVESVPDSIHPRAILESQFLSIRARIAAILPDDAPPLRRVVITGGSSANHAIRQIAANIFNMKVYTSSTKESAGMGGALLAKYAKWKMEQEATATFEDMSDGKMGGMECVAEPTAVESQIYDDLVGIWDSCEAHAAGTRRTPMVT